MTDNTQKAQGIGAGEILDCLHQINNMTEAEIKAEPSYVKEMAQEAVALLSQPPEASEVEADYGWVMYGPDGNWHWSKKKDLHECIEDQRPATPLEKCLFNAVGNSTENLTSYPPKASSMQELQALEQNKNNPRS